MKINNSLLQALIIGALVGAGVLVGMVIAPVMAQSTYAHVGYVDIETALAAHPDLDTVLANIAKYEDAKINELTKFQNVDQLTPEQRTQLMNEIKRVQSEVEAERQRLTNPLIDDIVEITGKVGTEAGIEVILESKSVMWGGLNLTPLVVQRLKK